MNGALDLTTLTLHTGIHLSLLCLLCFLAWDALVPSEAQVPFRPSLNSCPMSVTKLV